ncbi:MAG TPA: formate dehydrogenase subunit gamma [Amaricoccus sp.]|uniref:formate dehydrogenase subunit gamma n=1 Tax=Amaricoccus sp. TaxID=1872485 RepID=UPI002BEFA299|nr:formate dehydrogenase subunit gamma [Amaricoccus sp.]HMQ94770.1 formate dehydrogenase subunit gamma [Amaricoccus sp.]HMR37585.1 formate dehydrogenase subunit gamma [Paracoccus sp. (in: a-proteobacteria)]HMR53283.1 formate dehydrogenase subunit gamma [Amaricoccus sp.]HMU00254.1 formate dehydrogenase subunit gamma [Amaricoccus sp.]
MQSPNGTLTLEELGHLISEHRDAEGALLPILHAIQDACGCIPDAAHRLICDALNISEAELRGVISFYHDFREKPAGRHVLKVCRAEACQSVGGDAVVAALLDRLGLDWHGTTANGAVTVEPVYCLGLCACGPAAMVDGRVLGRVDAAKLDALLAEAGA